MTTLTLFKQRLRQARSVDENGNLPLKIKYYLFRFVSILNSHISTTTAESLELTGDRFRQYTVDSHSGLPEVWWALCPDLIRASEGIPATITAYQNGET